MLRKRRLQHNIHMDRPQDMVLKHNRQFLNRQLLNHSIVRRPLQVLHSLTQVNSTSNLQQPPALRPTVSSINNLLQLLNNTQLRVPISTTKHNNIRLKNLA